MIAHFEQSVNDHKRISIVHSTIQNDNLGTNGIVSAHASAWGV